MSLGPNVAVLIDSSTASVPKLQVVVMQLQCSLIYAQDTFTGLQYELEYSIEEGLSITWITPLLW